jgi:hypothetical protein
MALRWTLAGFAACCWPMSAAASCLRSSSAADGRNSAIRAIRRAGGAAGLFRLLFDHRNRDDGLQPPSLAPHGKRGRSRRATGPRPAGPHRQDAGCDPARQQPGQCRRRNPGVGHHHRALRRGKMGAFGRHPARHLRHAGVRRNHAEGGSAPPTPIGWRVLGLHPGPCCEPPIPSSGSSTCSSSPALACCA